MSDLLELAIAAHGGMQRWQRLTKLTAHASIGGAIWQLKGRAGVLADVHITVDPHRQHVEYLPFGIPGRRSIYEPQGTAIVTDGGETVQSREAPRQAFAGHGYATPWDDQHLIYFSGYAMWTYLTTPFLFILPGVVSEEIEPWNENGETWRRLKVNFPAEVHTHSTEQIFYFDSSGILRRHDYSVDVIGGSSSANYASEPRSFGGIVFPTRRRVYTTGPDNKPRLDRVGVAIDFHNIEPAYV